MSLELRNGITCNLCRKPMTDLRTGHLLWGCTRKSLPKIVVAHKDCDNKYLKPRYPPWEHLHHIVDDQNPVIRGFENEILMEAAR
jgi:hypothetical protein